MKITRSKKKFSAYARVFLIFLLTFFFQSCIKNRTGSPEMSNIANHCFELEQDVFIVWMSGDYILYRPGSVGFIPISAEAFRKEFPNPGTAKLENIKIVKKGTKIKIVKIVEESNFFDAHTWIYGYL